jgi:hypothetical protein
LAGGDPFESDEEYAEFLADLYAYRRAGHSRVILELSDGCPPCSARAGVAVDLRAGSAHLRREAIAFHLDRLPPRRAPRGRLPIPTPKTVSATVPVAAAWAQAGGTTSCDLVQGALPAVVSVVDKIFELADFGVVGDLFRAA